MGTAGDITTEADGQEPPAGADPPSRRSESTWWPIICAVGATGLYLGAGLYFFGNGEIALVPAMLGPVVFLAGGVVFFAGVFGWLYHAFIVDFWTRGTDEREPHALRGAMVLFLATDVATFGGGFAYYFFIRVGRWPPGELPELLSTLLVVNTIILVSSSFTLHFAHTALENEDRQRFLSLLGSTVILGVLFVLGQGYEYYGFIVEDGFTISSGMFGSAFFGLTGLHGLHVTLGAILLGITFIRGVLGQYSAERDTSLVTVSFYWHFVDVVWLLIIALLYVGASVTTIPYV